MLAALLSIESQLEGIDGSIYVLSTAGMLFLCSIMVICVLVSVLYFVKLVLLSWEVDRMKRINQASFANVRDWISLLAEEKINLCDGDFIEAVKEVTFSINKRIENVEKDYPIDENEGMEITLPDINPDSEEDDDDDSSIEDDDENEGSKDPTDDHGGDESSDGGPPPLEDCDYSRPAPLSPREDDDRLWIEKKLPKGLSVGKGPTHGPLKE